MKRILLVSILLMLIASGNLLAQDSPEWNKNSSSLSVYIAGPLGINTNLSYGYQHFTGSIFLGFSAGLTVSKYIVDGVGPHLTYDMMFGKRSSHFETKFGLSVPIDNGYPVYIPVVSLSYRYQKPGGKVFFRAGVNTALFGIGAGVVLN